MKKYEYVIHNFEVSQMDKPTEKTGSFLNTLGQMGWELVALVPTTDSKGEVASFYFKRELLD